MSATAAGWTLLAAAIALCLAGAPQAALLLALAAGGCAVMAPTPDQRAARFRNQARPWR